jgi:hypothetical protein
MNKAEKLRVEAFIKHVKEECKLYGIKCKLRPVKYVMFSKTMKCSGWFDSGNLELVVATNRPDYLSTLVHEYGHLTQWADQCDVWVDAGDSMNYVDKWLTGKRVVGIKKKLDLSRDLELDNEKRSVKIIKKWNLPIDIDLYTKKANSYVYFYNWIYITRRWSNPTNSPYTNKNLIAAMPKTFNVDHTQLPERLRKVFEQENI